MVYHLKSRMHAFAGFFRLERRPAKPVLVSEVHLFLRQHVLHRLEAMSLMDEVSEAIRMLVMLEEWAKVRPRKI